MSITTVNLILTQQWKKILINKSLTLFQRLKRKNIHLKQTCYRSTCLKLFAWARDCLGHDVENLFCCH